MAYKVDFESLIKELGLYKPIDLSEQDCLGIAKEIIYSKSSIDLYCPSCKSHSIFKHQFFDYAGNVNDKTRNITTNPNSPVIFMESFECARNKDHTATLILMALKSKLIKIGQFPSIADIVRGDFNIYKKAIGEQYYEELTKSIALFAHGVGIGAYVYLRRIFEALIDETHEIAKKSEGWNEDEYATSKAKEKIELLSCFLPELVIKNKVIYPILSKGIHELSEDECRKYYPALLNSIKSILEQKEQTRQKSESDKALKNELSKIMSDLKGRDSL